MIIGGARDDGREIVTRHIFVLAPLATVLAVLSTIGVFGNFLVNFVNLGHTFKWW